MRRPAATPLPCTPTLFAWGHSHMGIPMPHPRALHAPCASVPQAIVAAPDVAKTYSQQIVETEHLLKALLEQPNGEGGGCPWPWPRGVLDASRGLGRGAPAAQLPVAAGHRAMSWTPVLD